MRLSTVQNMCSLLEKRTLFGPWSHVVPARQAPPLMSRENAARGLPVGRPRYVRCCCPARVPCGCPGANRVTMGLILPDNRRCRQAVYRSNSSGAMSSLRRRPGNSPRIAERRTMCHWRIEYAISVSRSGSGPLRSRTDPIALLARPQRFPSRLLWVMSRLTPMHALQQLAVLVVRAAACKEGGEYPAVAGHVHDLAGKAPCMFISRCTRANSSSSA